MKNAESKTDHQPTLSPPCDCTVPGWCARHQMEKTRVDIHVCKVRPVIRAAMDENANPTIATIGTATVARTTTGTTTSTTKPRSRKCEYLDRVVDRRGSNCPNKWHRVCEIHGLTTLQPTRDGSGLVNCRDCEDYLPELRPGDPDPQVQR